MLILFLVCWLLHLKFPWGKIKLLYSILSYPHILFPKAYRSRQPLSLQSLQTGHGTLANSCQIHRGYDSCMSNRKHLRLSPVYTSQNVCQPGTSLHLKPAIRQINLNCTGLDWPPSVGRQPVCVPLKFAQMNTFTHPASGARAPAWAHDCMWEHTSAHLNTSLIDHRMCTCSHTLQGVCVYAFMHVQDSQYVCVSVLCISAKRQNNWAHLLSWDWAWAHWPGETVQVGSLAVQHSTSVLTGCVR